MRLLGLVLAAIAALVLGDALEAQAQFVKVTRGGARVKSVGAVPVAGAQAFAAGGGASFTKVRRGLFGRRSITASTGGVSGAAFVAPQAVFVQPQVFAVPQATYVQPQVFAAPQAYAIPQSFAVPQVKFQQFKVQQRVLAVPYGCGASLQQKNSIHSHVRFNAFGTRTVVDSFGDVYEVDVFGRARFSGNSFGVITS